jgi:hypothetical protein
MRIGLSCLSLFQVEDQRASRLSGPLAGLATFRVPASQSWHQELLDKHSSRSFRELESGLSGRNMPNIGCVDKLSRTNNSGNLK